MNLRELKQIISKGEDGQNQFKGDLLDSEDFEGSLPDIFRGALNFIMGNLRKVQGNKSVNSIGDPEIPRAVVEKLLVDALIHRGRFIGAPVRIFVFDDHVEIISPGTLANRLKMQKIRTGNSVQRNRVLTSLIAKGLLSYRDGGTSARSALKNWVKIEFIEDGEVCLFRAVVKRAKVI